MAFVPYNTLIPEVNQHAPNAPHPIIIAELNKGAREVCQTTKMWEYVQPPRALTPGVGEYDYEIDFAQVEVNTIRRVRVNNNIVMAVSRDDINALYPEYRNPELRGQPIHFAHYNNSETEDEDDSGNYIVAPIPDAVIPYKVDIAMTLKPTQFAKGIEGDILDRIGAVIIEYAIHRLQLTPGTGYFNTELAAFHKQEYEVGLARLRANQNLAPVREILTVIPPPGF